MEIFRYENGHPGWFELGTIDINAAKQFYSNVFQWQYEDNVLPGGMTYTLCKRDGKDVTAMYRLPEEQIKNNVPPHWLIYFGTKDMDTSVKTIESTGGNIILKPMDVMDMGRMAVVQDNVGAVFALWQEKKDIKAKKVDMQPGSVAWVELMTNHVDKSTQFYTTLFNWNIRLENTPDHSKYYSFAVNGVECGGIMPISKEMGDIPNYWSLYILSDDCQHTADLIVKNGGQMLVPPTKIETICTFAVFMDPQGANFSVIQFAERMK